jgi:hypothetical protein
VNGAPHEDEAEERAQLPLNDEAAKGRVRWRKFGEEKGCGICQEFPPDPTSRICTLTPFPPFPHFLTPFPSEAKRKIGRSQAKAAQARPVKAVVNLPPVQEERAEA